jgi:methionine biosynthesis protein MetW
MASPDHNGRGLTTGVIDPLRYHFNPSEPHEVGSCIQRLMDRGLRVLDVGCGKGQLLRFLADHFDAEGVGIEPDEQRVEFARQLGITVHHGLFDTVPFSKLGKFDVVLFCDVLEHLADPGAALQSALSLLRPGGYVLASIPNVAHWSVRWDLLFGRFDYYHYGIRDATHLRWFTRKTVCNVFSDSGYRIERMLTTAGTGLPEYYHRLPWRAIPRSIRNRFIWAASAAMPTLFGCQFVVKAVPVLMESCHPVQAA